MDLFPMHSWHPVVIHFPLVALSLAVMLDLIAALSRSPRWREAATLLWWIGMAGAVAAVATGLIAYSRVEHSEPGHARMTLHRNLAFVALAILLASGVWRWRRPLARGAALVGVVGVGGLLSVGYLGGELVFRHAIGIPTAILEAVVHERGGHEHDDAAGEAGPSPGAPAADADSAAGHDHDGPGGTC